MCRIDLASWGLFTGSRRRTLREKIRPDEARLERFRFKGFHLKTVRGGIFFHPIDKDLSLGAPERKMPLGPEVSRKSRIETALMLLIS
jgi:hypothetical protein